MRSLLTTLAFLLPFNGLKIRLLNWAGHDIHPTAHVGICLVKSVDRFEIGEGAILGHFNVIGRVRLVKLGPGSMIAFFNLITVGVSGADLPDTDDPELADVRGTLRLGERAQVISFHMLDCSGGVVLKDNAWLTGWRTTLLSHAFDPSDGGLIAEPIVLEERAVVGTSCTILPGVVVGEGAVLAAGSALWTRQNAAAECLHGGVPARRLAPVKIPESAFESVN